MYHKHVQALFMQMQEEVSVLAVQLGMIDSNRYDRANRSHIEFDSSVWFQLQKPRHHDRRRENEDIGS